MLNVVSQASGVVNLGFGKNARCPSGFVANRLQNNPAFHVSEGILLKMAGSCPVHLCRFHQQRIAARAFEG